MNDESRDVLRNRHAIVSVLLPILLILLLMTGVPHIGKAQPIQGKGLDGTEHTYVEIQNNESNGSSRIDALAKQVVTLETSRKELAEEIQALRMQLNTALRQYDTLPIGTILSYIGDTAILDGSGWVLANGDPLPPGADEALNSYLGGKTPNLNTDEGVFLAGSSSLNVQKIFGQRSMQRLTVSASGQAVAVPPADVRHVTVPGGHVVNKIMHAHDKDRPNHWVNYNNPVTVKGHIVDHESHDNRPPFFKVHYIIRVR